VLVAAPGDPVALISGLDHIVDALGKVAVQLQSLLYH
jgi:hypothetical protein